MYEHFYGLRERPFDLSPNPRFLFLSRGHKEALTHLRYGLSGRPGITVVAGEAGTGKTTLVRAALQSVAANQSKVVHLSNPTLTRQEFYEYLATEYGFGANAVDSKTTFLRELGLALTAAAESQSVLALVVDEAQSLPHALLEEIRLLTNTEGASGNTVAIAMVGQPELAARLNDPSLRQLKQRVALRCELLPLDLNETAAYVAARIRVAGGRPDQLFTRDAILAIHQHSAGIPRTISVLCDNSLVTGFALDIKPVGRQIVEDVCRDFELALSKNLPRGGAAPLPEQPPRATIDDEESANAPLFGNARRRFSFF
jgi:type II secretory pathway predicted ATPase ExeA